jgi:hypothetical protein
MGCAEITGGLTWIQVPGYVRKWRDAVARFLGLREGSSFKRDHPTRCFAAEYSAH